jgi:hypothetical protein
LEPKRQKTKNIQLHSDYEPNKDDVDPDIRTGLDRMAKLVHRV